MSENDPSNCDHLNTKANSNDTKTRKVRLDRSNEHSFSLEKKINAILEDFAYKSGTTVEHLARGFVVRLQMDGKDLRRVA